MKTIKSALSIKYNDEIEVSTRGGLSATDSKDEDKLENMFKSKLTSYLQLEKVFGEKFYINQKLFNKAEDLIYLLSIFEEKSAILQTLKEQGYSENQIKIINNLKFKGWATISKKLIVDLKCKYYYEKTGEYFDASILYIMYHEPLNFVSIIENLDNSSNKLVFDFKNQIEVLNNVGANDITIEDMIENSYSSNAVKRATRQSFKIIDELLKILKIDHFDKIFVEVTREHRATKTPPSRQKTLKEYMIAAKKFVSDLNIVDEQFKTITNDQLKSKKLFHYFTQLGRDVYTGKKIDLDELDKYDIDHIIPQAYIKDDSFLNTVLVEKSINNIKQDSYPLPRGTVLTDEGIKWIKILNSIKDKKKHSYFMSNDKMNRILRLSEFSDDEKIGFVNRQLTTTNQSCKAVLDILKKVYKGKTEIIYSKSNIVSSFRNIYGILKCRDINDFHHAHDAYLNIVCGNVYDNKFSSIRSYTLLQKLRETNPHISFKTDPEIVFSRDVYSKDRLNIVWKTDYDKENKIFSKKEDSTITIILRNLRYYDPLCTNMSLIRNEMFRKVSIKSTKLGEIAKIPLKNNNLLDCDGYEADYGGYSDLSTACFSLVKSKDKKDKYSYYVLPVKNIFLKQFKNDLLDAVEKSNPDIKNIQFVDEDFKVIKIYDVLEIPTTDNKGVVKLGITGISGQTLICVNRNECIYDQETTEYIRAISKLLGNNLQAGKKVDLSIYGERCVEINISNILITKNNNLKIFNNLQKILKKSIFNEMPVISSTIKKIITIDNINFINLNLIDQARIIDNIIKILNCKSAVGMSFRILREDLPNTCGAVMSNYKLKENTKIIKESVTGFYRKEFIIPR